MQEIRDAVLDFKTSGKPVYAYLEYGGDREYYLATAADKIFTLPAAHARSERRRDLRLVPARHARQDRRVSRSAPHRRLQDRPESIHRKGLHRRRTGRWTESLNRDLYEQLVRGIAEGRKKSDADVRRLIDEGPFLPEDALRAGLLDEVAYEDQVDDKLRKRAAAIAAWTATTTGASAPRSLGLNRGPRIAVIYASGIINSGKSGYDPVNGAIAGSETLNDYIRQARRDSSVRAIVLRIDSPGGSASASDAIWRELMLARNERADRPLVASMSDLAASGGYYIAMPAQVIVAQPATLTGSIGIYGGKYVTGGVYEKLGARIDSTSVGRHAEINSPARPYNPEELKKVEEQLHAFYDQFVEKAAQSRHTKPEKNRRAGPGTRVDRPAGKSQRARRRAGRSRSRHRRREAGRQDSHPERG